MGCDVPNNDFLIDDLCGIMNDPANGSETVIVGGKPVRGVWTRQYDTLTPIDAVFAGAVVSLTVQTADVTDVTKGTLVLIDGEPDLYITSIQPQDAGSTELILSLSAD